VTLRRGCVARAWTSESECYLGGVVYELGMIDGATLNETLAEVAQAKRLHGEILMERGAITKEQLHQALAEQTCRKVHALFTFPDETRWSFVESVQRARDEARPEIDAWHAIWRGLREHPPVVHLKRTLARAEGSIKIRDASVLDRFGLSAEERAVAIRLATEPVALVRLVAESPIGAMRTESLVYLFALARCLARVNVDPVGPANLGRDGIVQRAKGILEEDPYSVLGLPEGASPEAARAAYFRLARLWQRDRIPETYADLGPECELIFATICDAHRILTSTSLRPRATTSIGDAIDERDRPALAKPSLGEADKALERNDLAGAITIAESLVLAGADGPAARAVLVWCASGAGRAPNDDLEKAVSALDKVLSGDPECVRAIFYRGQLHKRLGHTELAMRDFRKVTRIDPRHFDATREVRLFEMRAPVRRDSASMEAAGSGLRRLIDRAIGTMGK
jgi:tetratricopeptide (TPR) repeat protein